MIIDKLTSLLVIHNKSSRFKGRAINILLTNQSQVHPKGVTKAHMSEGPIHTLVNIRNRTVHGDFQRRTMHIFQPVFSILSDVF